MAERLVSMKGFSYRYPGAASDAVCAIDVDVAEGEFVIIAGRSGSGKSTLLRAVCGLVPHYHGGEVAGELEVCGLDVRAHGPADLGGHVGLVDQDPETDVVSTTVRGELELPLELRGEPSAARARAVEEAALALGIEAILDRPTDTLSGGELQRVALAATLVLRPSIVLLDEPTSQLDPVAGDELVGLLRRLNEEWGMTVLLAEHRLERCLAAADRVLALDGGRISFDGAPQRFLDWALASDLALATPAARMFALLGLPAPAPSVKDARRTLNNSAGSLAFGSPNQRHTPLSPLKRLTDTPGGRGPGPYPAGTSASTGTSSLARARSLRDEVVLAAKGLWVELEGRDVIRDLSLRVGAGERVALMGRNGAGKSTLLRVAAGLLDPVRGAIQVPRGCALVPQSPTAMLVRERVGDELPGAEGAAALEQVGLGAFADADPRDLSGGERQRLAIAIAMAGRGEGSLPGSVCLDEPTRGMDWARKTDLAASIDGLTRQGVGVIVATHDVEFAALFAQRVLLLGDGVLLAEGPADEVLSGGWYFATEVARILRTGGAITPEQGAALLLNSAGSLASGSVSGGRGPGPDPAGTSASTATSSLARTKLAPDLLRKRGGSA